MQRYCFFLIYANIFEKKMLFSGEKMCFLFFLGVAVMGLEGIETIKTIEAIVWHFFFWVGGGAGVLRELLLLFCFFLRFVAVFLPSFCRPFAVFVSRLKAAGMGQGDYKKKHRNCYVKIKKTNFICVFQINVVSLRAFRQMIVNSMYCETK